MNFTSQMFLFVFLPIVIVVYILLELITRSKSYKNKVIQWMLIIASLVFYGKNHIKGIIFMFSYSVVVFIMGKLVRKKQKITIFLCLLILSGYLFACKYLGFSMKVLGVNYSHSLWVPIGISFISFSAISYLVDIYRGDATSGNFSETILYLVFFPKIISGPIVLWKDFENQMNNRRSNINMQLDGVNRIIIGFGKKLILADYFGAVIFKIHSMGLDHVDVITAWLSILLYSMQIYYDFSGYSDIAIGLGKIFGFNFKENFNFPYCSSSISEFWRRWHISLGSWFKEYVYIPLGGNREGKVRTLFNLGIVFLITGIWHGAGWNYIAWGIAHGLFIIFERCIKDKKIYKNIPLQFKSAITFLVVSLGWQTFCLDSFTKTMDMYRKLIGLGTTKYISFTYEYFLSKKTISMLCIAILGSIILGNHRISKLRNLLTVENKVTLIIKEILLMCIMFFAVMCMYNNTYSPFIYFQY